MSATGIHLCCVMLWVSISAGQAAQGLCGSCGPAEHPVSVLSSWACTAESSASWWQRARTGIRLGLKPLQSVAAITGECGLLCPAGHTVEGWYSPVLHGLLVGGGDLLFRPMTLLFTALPQWRQVLQHESALSQWFWAVLLLMAVREGFSCVPSRWK